MKVFEVLRETTEQEIAQAAKGMVAKAKAGDIGGAADDMERVHNSIARMDIGSGLYDFMQKTLKQLKSLVASNPNHPEAPKFVQAIKDIEAGMPAMKQAAADSRRMAVDAGAGRQDVGEGLSDWFKKADNPQDMQQDVVPMVKQLLDQGMSEQEVVAQVEQELGVRPRYIQQAIRMVRAGLAEGRLKSKSYKKSYKAAKASGRRRNKSLRDSQENNAAKGAAMLSNIDMALDGSGLKRQGFELVKDTNSFTRGSITREAEAAIRNSLAKANALLGGVEPEDPRPTMSKAELAKQEFGEGMYETATGMGAASIASVSGNVGTMQSRNMYNDDGTMKNGVDFDNLLGGKKKTKKKQKTA